MPDDPSIRVVAQIKNNLEQEGVPVAFQIEDGNFNWIGEYEITVEELLGGFKSENKSAKAQKFLKGLLENNDSYPANEIILKGKNMEISKRTLENTKQELGIKSIRVGSGWHWKLE